MYRSKTCGELTIKNVGEEVTLSGWVQKSRVLGGMTFVDLRDRYGLTQLAFNMETNAELCAAANQLGREYVIQVTGNVTERSSKNNQIPTGDYEPWFLVRQSNDRTQFGVKAARFFVATRYQAFARKSHVI